MTASAATYCTCPELKAANASFGLEVEVSDVSPNSFMTAQALVEETCAANLAPVVAVGTALFSDMANSAMPVGR